MNPAIIAIGAIAAQRAVGLIHRWQTGNSCSRLTFVFQPDQRRPDRHTANKAARAVDRIDDPAVAGIARRIARLLAQKTIFRKLAEKDGTQQVLGAAVGQRYGSTILFPFDTEAGIKVGERKLSRLPRCVLGNFVARAPIGVHYLPSFFRGGTRYSTVFSVTVGGSSYGKDIRNATRSSMSFFFK